MRFQKNHQPWNKGKKLSAEMREKLSIAHRGQIGHMKGKHHTEETKLKISKALKGKSFSTKKSKYDVNFIIKRYNVLKNISKTAKEVGISISWLRILLKRNNIKIFKYKRSKKYEKYKNIIIDLYKSGKSAVKISEILPINIHYSSIFKCLRENNIKIKERGFQPGNKNPSWNYGLMNHCGYKLIANTIHPRSRQGFVEEHVLVMEEKIGRSLKKGEVVHHIDRNKLNNDPENLMLFKNNSEHMKYHWKNNDISPVRNFYRGLIYE